MRVKLTNLTLHEKYSLRASAFTQAGLGPFSPPTAFKMDPALIKFSDVVTQPSGISDDLITEPWFVALLGIVVLALLLVFVGIVVYRRHWLSGSSNATAAKASRGPASLQRYDNMNRLDPDSMWSAAGDWKGVSSTGSGNGPQVKTNLHYNEQSVYAEVGESTTTSTCVDSFANNSGLNEPAPYATTTLAMQNRVRTLVSLSVHACHITSSLHN